MAVKTRKLTKLQKRFIAEYPKDLCGSEAVIRAGYRVKNKQIAAEIAHALVNNSEVKKILDREEEERLHKAGVQAEKVKTRMAHLAFADIRKIYGPENTLLPVKDFPDEVIPAIAGVKTTELFDGTGEDRHLVGYTKEVRLWNPDTSLTNMAKNLGEIGNGKHRDEDEEEAVSSILTHIELSHRIVYLLKLAFERKKEAEGEKKGDANCNSESNK